METENIFRHFKQRDRNFSFANAYPNVFFEYIASGKQRLSVTTMSLHLNDIRLNTVEDVIAGKALTADITNERWNDKLGYELPVITPKEGAERLLRIAEENEFTCFEYFMTDHLGHWRNKDEFDYTFKVIDEFLYNVITLLDKEKHDAAYLFRSREP